MASIIRACLSSYSNNDIFSPIGNNCIATTRSTIHILITSCSQRNAYCLTWCNRNCSRHIRAAATTTTCSVITCCSTTGATTTDSLDSDL